MVVLVAGLLAIGAALGPASSWAATASVSSGNVNYTAAAGEDNDVTVSLSSDSTTYTIRDPGETITLPPQSGCATVSGDATDDEVNCSSTGVTDGVWVDLGDLDDDMTINGSFRARSEGGPGSDRLNGGSGIDIIFGGDGGDFLEAGAGITNQLSGEAGNDVENGGPGRDNFLQPAWGADDSDLINGGEDIDSVSYFGRTADLDVTLNGQADDGDPAASGGAGERDNVGGVANDVENVTTGSGVDEITGNDAANFFFAGDGGDTASGGAGDDSFNQSGDTDGPDTMHGGDGTDTALYGNRNDGDGPHSMSLDGENNDGANSGGEGDNVDADIENVEGGGGPDTITGNGDPNWLSGHGGTDTLRGADGPDRLTGGGSPDTYEGGNGADELVQTVGGDGTDTLSGGNGSDTADYSALFLALTITLDGTANDGGSVEFFFDNVGGAANDVENVTGGTNSDQITGNDSFNRLKGGPVGAVAGPVDTLNGAGGNDIIDGEQGNDVENGGLGNDTFYQGDVSNGQDTLNGGDDVDTADYGERTQRVEVSLDAVANDGASGPPAEQDNVGGAAGDVENARAGSGGSSLVGNGLGNELTGGGGGDNLFGQGGNDTLDGAAEADNLFGGDNDDRLLSRDASADFDHCGDGTDSVVPDAQDTLDEDCEQTAPISIAAPSVSGLAHEDEVLTADGGTWSGAPSPTFSYQWRRCDDSTPASCAAIAGAAGATYAVAAADIGKRIRVRVTATNAAGSDLSDSQATEAVVANPDTQITSGPSEGSLTRDATPTFGFGFRSGTGSELECRVGSATFADCTAPHTLATQPDGSRTFEVRAVDSSGHPDPSPARRTFTIDATRPVAGGPPTHVLPRNAQLGASTVPVSFRWPAGSDNMTLAGALNYDLQRKLRSGSTWGAPTRVFGPARSTSSTQALLPSRTYRFGDRAIDRAGNTSSAAYGPPVTATRLQEAPSSALTYSGSWKSTARSSASGGKVRSSTQKGAGATLAFRARQIGVVMPKGPSLGGAQICIDPGKAGQFCQNVDLSPSSGPVGPRLIVFARTASPGLHQLRVRVTSGRAELDAFVLLS